MVELRLGTTALEFEREDGGALLFMDEEGVERLGVDTRGGPLRVCELDELRVLELDALDWLDRGGLTRGCETRG